jgi:hypothetical protein
MTRLMSLRFVSIVMLIVAVAAVSRSVSSSCREADTRPDSDAVWRDAGDVQRTRELRELLLTYFRREREWARGTLESDWADRQLALGATRDHITLLETKMMALSLADAIATAKLRAFDAGRVKSLPMAIMGAPYIGDDYLLFFGSYPEAGAMVFRVEAALESDAWGALLTLARMQDEARLAGSRLAGVQRAIAK